MRTITRSMLFALMMGAFLFASAQKGGGDNMLKKKIQAYNNQMVQAILSGDDEKSMSFYHKDVISMPNYGEMMRGLDAMAEHQKENKEKGNKITAMKLTTKMVTEYGDALVEIGRFSLTYESPKLPQPVSDEGKYLTIWVKDEKGSYKIINQIWNTDVHPMQAMKGQKPKGEEKPNPNSEQHKKLNKSGGETKSGSEKKPSASEKKGN